MITPYGETLREIYKLNSREFRKLPGAFSGLDFSTIDSFSMYLMQRA